MSYTNSPLRYPGGKYSLWRYLALIIEKNQPINTYIEPFAGGGGAALTLLYKGIVEKIVLNELDPYIYSFWFSVLYENEKFIEKIKQVSLTINEWNFQRRFYFDKRLIDTSTILDKGFAAFYLNRTNRSGIWYAGPIGGRNQDGDWLLDVRFNKTVLIKKIEKIGNYRNRISISNKDAIVFLKTNHEIITNKNNTLLYLDPPYYRKGKSLYKYYYTEKDHLELFNFLQNNMNYKWVLSYDDVPFISNLYSSHRKNGIKINHMINRSKVGSELIISSDNCILPIYNKDYPLITQKRRKAKRRIK